MVSFYRSVQTNTIPEYGHIIHLTTKSHHVLIFHTFEVRVHLAILRMSELFMFYSICYIFCGLGDSFCRYFRWRESRFYTSESLSCRWIWQLRISHHHGHKSPFTRMLPALIAMLIISQIRLGIFKVPTPMTMAARQAKTRMRREVSGSDPDVLFKEHLPS